MPVTRGTYGYYSVRSNAVKPKQGLITEGDISSTMLGFFVQDAWTINNKLTINLGLRTERERVPTYTTGDGHSGVRPRVRLRRQAGAARRLRLRHQGRRQAGRSSGSWGVFYDIFKLELPRGSFGGDKWLAYYYTLDTFNWPTLVDGANCPPACNGTLIRGTDSTSVTRRSAPTRSNRI